MLFSAVILTTENDECTQVQFLMNNKLIFVFVKINKTSLVVVWRNSRGSGNGMFDSYNVKISNNVSVNFRSLPFRTIYHYPIYIYGVC